MGYLIAAYVVVAVGVGAYTLHLTRRRRALKALRPRPADPGARRD